MGNAWSIFKSGAAGTLPPSFLNLSPFRFGKAGRGSQAIPRVAEAMPSKGIIADALRRIYRVFALSRLTRTTTNIPGPDRESWLSGADSPPVNPETRISDSNGWPPIKGIRTKRVYRCNACHHFDARS